MGQMVLDINQQCAQGAASDGSVPCWVPRSVQNYIDHTEMGVPIRALARQQGCHASTILRQIRRVETLRDDPLVDGALKTLGGGVHSATDPAQHGGAQNDDQGPPDQRELTAQGVRVLRRLCETGAVLAVAADLEKAVIVRDGQSGEGTRTGVVDRAIVEAMALKGWIAAPTPGRITRYQITAGGRSALTDMMAQNENALAGLDSDAPGAAQSETPRRIRYGMAESPLVALARRRDKDGAPFLSDDLVRVGERLREDFELAQMAAEVSKDWDSFMSALRNTATPRQSSGSGAAQRAQARAVAALKDLGPGLSEVTLRCCCFLEGLETAERSLGWSARSGKIVLRIALMGLKRHYTEKADPSGAFIG